MSDFATTLTLIGGPTLLIEIGGFRLLTDPTFDAPGDYQSGPVTLRKTQGPRMISTPTISTPPGGGSSPRRRSS